MKALVTGGAGFIGSALGRKLIERGDEVRIIDNLVTGLRSAVPTNAEFVNADIRDVDAVAEAMRGIDVVFHEAAFKNVARSLDDPATANSTNVTGTLNVVMAAADAGVRRLVYASSSSLYGSRHSIQVEDAVPSPHSPYAVSKLAGEHYCRTWASLGLLSTVCLRYFNVFGPGQHPDSQYAALFPAIIGALCAGASPVIHWDGEQSRDFTFVDDVVAANLRAAEADENCAGQVFNIGAGDPKTVNDVVRTVSNILDTWVEPTYVDKRVGDIRTSHADITRSREILGWEPRADWKQAVAATVEWFGDR